MFIIFCFGLGPREGALRSWPPLLTSQSLSGTFLCFAGSRTEPHMAAALARARPLPSLPWAVCKFRAAWGCFSFASRRGKPLGTERWAKVLPSLRARSSSCEARLVSALQRSKPKQRAARLAWGRRGSDSRCYTGSYDSERGHVLSSATFSYPHLRPLIHFSLKPQED